MYPPIGATIRVVPQRALSEIRNRSGTAAAPAFRVTNQSTAGDAGVTGRVNVDDPYGHETLAAPWEFVIRAQSRGAYRWRVHHVTTPSFVIYREHVSGAVRMSGRSPIGMLAFLIPNVTAPRSSLWKQPLRDESISAAMQTAIDVTFGPGQCHYMVLLQESFLRRSLPEEHADEIERWARARVLPASPGGVQSLATWIKTTLAEAERHPEFLRCPLAVDALGEELVQRLWKVFLPSSARRHDHVSPRFRVVGSALDVLAANAEPLTVPELSRAIGVSQRALEYAFRNTFDETPHNFVRRQQLHEARHRLLTADSSTSSVTRVAVDLGFWHLSRFAVDYRRMFGERPSETLRRTLPDVKSPFLLR
jgi:AraC-like DNA-binding protein